MIKFESILFIIMTVLVDLLILKEYRYILKFYIFRHPDKTDDPEATEKFTKINEAYEVNSLL